MTTLVRTRTVYEKVAFNGTDVYYTSEGRTFMLPTDLWKEMGEPETITLTVEPGNRLT